MVADSFLHPLLHLPVTGNSDPYEHSGCSSRAKWNVPDIAFAAKPGQYLLNKTVSTEQTVLS